MMGIDINKIIMESIQDSDPSETQQSTSTTPITQLPDEPKLPEVHSGEGLFTDDFYKSIYDIAIPSSLSAGLGAIMLRTKIRNLNEIDTDTITDFISNAGKGAWKVASKVGEAGVESGKKIANAAVEGYNSSPDSAKPVIAGAGAVLGIKAASSLARKARDARDRLSNYVAGNNSGGY